MSILPLFPIRKYGDSILRAKCQQIEKITSGTEITMQRMARTMYQAGGVGLAAPQVGIARQFLVVDAGDGLIKMVNPQVIWKEGRSVLEEGCLSLPGILIRVPRARRVRIKALDEKGEEIEIEEDGLLAHVLQHEIDHLGGILILDYASPIERSYAENKLRGLS